MYSAMLVFVIDRYDLRAGARIADLPEHPMLRPCCDASGGERQSRQRLRRREPLPLGLALAGACQVEWSGRLAKAVGPGDTSRLLRARSARFAIWSRMPEPPSRGVA